MLLQESQGDYEFTRVWVLLSSLLNWNLTATQANSWISCYLQQGNLIYPTDKWSNVYYFWYISVLSLPLFLHFHTYIEKLCNLKCKQQSEGRIRPPLEQAGGRRKSVSSSKTPSVVTKDVSASWYFFGSPIKKFFIVTITAVTCAFFLRLSLKSRCFWNLFFYDTLFVP